MFNSKSELYKQNIDDPTGIRDNNYRFKKSVKALKATLHTILGDLFRQGRKFIIERDNRYSHPKLLCAMNFFENPEIDEYKFEKELREEVAKIGRNRYFTRHAWMLEHPVYQELVVQLSKVYDHYTQERFLDNQVFAYLFLLEYYFRRNRRRKSG